MTCVYGGDCPPDECPGPCGNPDSPPKADRSLAASLAWLKTPDCPCPHDWKSYGTLDRISMGMGWVRMRTDPACPHHGESRPEPRPPR